MIYQKNCLGSASDKNLVKDKALSATLLVPLVDIEAVKSLELPVRLVAISAGERAFKLIDEAGDKVDFEVAMLTSVGCLAQSIAGQAELRNVADAWEEKFGTNFPPMVGDLDSMNTDRQEILAWLVGQMGAVQQHTGMRAARLMRELGILRRQHDEMQRGFSDLETFIYRNVTQKRAIDITLSPIAEQHAFDLRSGEVLSQRLPGSSVGLCDVSIFIDSDISLADGALHVSLCSLDTNRTLAIWEVPASELQKGWLRLGLERALGPDMVSLKLNVGYEGDGSVHIASSVHHPEERFWPRHGDKKMPTVLAMQIWRWIAGASAPMAARSIMPIGGINRMRRVLGETLTTARNAYDLKERLRLQSGTSALLIHVNDSRTAAGILSGIALSGTRHIHADILTDHEQAPEVEYCLAVLPSGQITESLYELPSFDSGMASDWVRLRPMEEGQVHLILPEPLTELHDVFMMTRLPPRIRTMDFGWSTFANLTLQF